MGRLVEQSVPTLYHGVSRQPPSVRLPGQVERADNALFSVVTGGFEKRPAGHRAATLPPSFGYTSNHVWTHVYERDENERYLFAISDGILKIFNDRGQEQPIEDNANILGTYLAQYDNRGYSFVTIGDHTLIANRSITVKMANEMFRPPGGQWIGIAPYKDAAVVQIKQTDPNYGAFWLRIDDIPDPINVNTLEGNINTTVSVASTLYERVNSAPGDTIDATYHGSFLGLLGKQEFNVGVYDFLGETATALTHKRVRSVDDLPALAYHEMVVEVGGKPSDEGSGYWVQFHADGVGPNQPWPHLSKGRWKECPAPGTKVRLDHFTMPISVVRDADGVFRPKYNVWAWRKHGDDETNPVPEFVGGRISDLAFHRDRLVIVSGETVTYSAAGDYFNFWPERQAEVVDSDPFSRTASTESVNILNHAVPFRSALFLTSTESQFELSAQGALTPSTAAIDLTTSYNVEPQCKPVRMGNELYLASSTAHAGIILEYYYDEASLGGTAMDASVHVLGYLPAPIHKLASHPSSGTLFALPRNERGTVYVYRTHWEGNEKAQSAWARWVFGGHIKSIEVVNDALFLIRRLPDTNEVILERLSLHPEGTDIYNPYPHRMDALTKYMGNYDPETDETTWDLPYESLDGIEVWGVHTMEMEPSDYGTRLNPERVDPEALGPTFEWKVSGKWTAGILVGVPYSMEVELSTIYPIENNQAITTGRLQLHRLHLDYVKAVEYEVRIGHPGRPDRVQRFDGRVVGSGAPMGGDPTPVSGTFSFRAPGNSRTTSIRIINDSVFPSTFVGFRWTGFFNEVSRQG